MRITKIMICMVWLMAVACGRGESELLKYASGESLAVATVDVAAVLENAGCQVTAQGVELSVDLRTAVGGSYRGAEREQALELLRLPGIDLSTVVAVVNGEGELLVAAAVRDREAVTQWLDGLYPSEDGEYAINRLTHLVVSDNELVLVRSPRMTDTPDAVINRFAAQAAQAPITDWQRKVLSAKMANAIIDMPRLVAAYHALTGRQLLPDQLDGYADIQAIANGYAVAHVTLDGNTSTGTLSFANGDGTLIPYTGEPTPPSALAFLTALPSYVSADYTVIDGIPTLMLTLSEPLLTALM